jgi:RNA polymerase sigma-70 factor (ECF subfamily)
VNEEPIEQELRNIPTIWTEIRAAHAVSPEVAARAQDSLARRYRGAVFNYLKCVGCTPDMADDITQRFFMSLLRGELRGATPERGNFRSLVKVVLFRLISRYHKESGAGPKVLPPDAPPLAYLAAPSEEDERQFDRSWRDELLVRTWQALARANSSYHAVLRLRAENPRMPSHQMAEQLSHTTGEPYSGAGIRKTLERARSLFTRLLAEEVGHALANPTVEAVMEELAELQLLEFCSDLLPGRGEKKTDV